MPSAATHWPPPDHGFVEQGGLGVRRQAEGPKRQPSWPSERFAQQILQALFRGCACRWEEGGLEILKAAVVKNPVAFARIMATLVPRDFDIEPPKRSVGFKAIWEKMGRGAVPPMTSPPGVDDP
jgi:hypothetical protein